MSIQVSNSYLQECTPLARKYQKTPQCFTAFNLYSQNKLTKDNLNVAK